MGDKKPLEREDNTPEIIGHEPEEKEKSKENGEAFKEKIRKILVDLGKTIEEKSASNEERFKELQEQARQAINPDENFSWQNNIAPQDLIQALTDQLTITLAERKNSSEAEVMKQATGRTMLEGVYVSDNFEELLTSREQLLDLPKNFSFSNSDQSTRFDIKEVGSREEEEHIRQSVSKLGYNVISSGGFSCLNSFGMNFNVGYQKSNDKENKERTNSLQNYICNTKYNYIPIAKCAFSANQLCLSEAALYELKLIDDSPLSDKSEKCAQFFERFGTHANKGPFTLGGIFCWKASSEGFQSHKFNCVKQENLSKLHGSANFNYLVVSAGISGERTDISASVNSNHTEESKHSVHLSVNKTGGPEEAENLDEWKKGLISSNKTWAVIDKELRLIPVWRIILENHLNHFKDAVSLAKSLETSYKSIKSSHIIEPTTREYEIRHLILNVKNWDSSNAISNLSKVWKLREYPCFIQNPHFRDFIMKIYTEHSQNPQRNTEYIKYLLTDILQNEIHEDNFSNHLKLQEWINPSFSEPKQQVYIPDVESFVKFAQMAIDSPTIDDFFREITSYLDKLRESMIEKNMFEEDFLVVITSKTFGYQHENQCFDHRLTKEEFSGLFKCLTKSFDTYKSLKSKKKEVRTAFLLLQGLTNQSGSKLNISSAQMRENWELMESKIEISDISDLLPSFNVNDPSFDWKQLELDLTAIVQETFISSQNKQSLENSKLEKQLKEIQLLQEQRESDSTVTKKDKQQQENQKHKEDKGLLKNPGNILKITETAQHGEKQSSTKGSDVPSSLTGQQWEVIKRLGLQEYYPRKLPLSKIMQIDDEVLKMNDNLNEDQLVKFFVLKLSMMDYRIRDLFQRSPTVESDSEEEEEEDSNDENETEEMQQMKKIHPMDIQMAIFHCSDSFLWQFIASKLATCLYAIPFIVPVSLFDLFIPSWSLLLHDKAWDIQNRGNSISLYDAKLPIVAFFRLSKTESISKSEIMSNLMTNHKHNIFFHRNSRASSDSCIFMDGVVEMAQYFPGGNAQDMFNETITFVNLHGDATKHEKQFKLLSQAATINILLVSGEDMKSERNKEIFNRLDELNKVTIFLRFDKKKTVKTKNKSQIEIAAANINHNFTEKLKILIQNQILVENKKKKSISSIVQAGKEQGCQIETDDPLFICNKIKAIELKEMLMAESTIQQIQKKFFQLQGKQYWHMWCKKNKELSRLKIEGGISIADHENNIRHSQRLIREEQLKITTPMNELMEKIVKNGSEISFIRYLEMFLKEMSLAKMDKDCESIQFHNILREIGQIFEALKSRKCTPESSKYLPELAAHLMISGLPLELMDGDASHIPVAWIKAVIESLIVKLGDKRIFILSVLGLQSHGKSTLLNSMFGLNFNTSAGRCTKGVYMQLVQVSERLQKERNVDYVLVIDTEGLRSQEASNKDVSDDNELATFVIGLASLTIINIMGENPSEMQDILQICVQAFLRMKEIHLTPSCIFVHQNVVDSDASDKNEKGQQQMIKKLNEMTKLAAQQENFEANNFNDVIMFNEKLHIHYFSHLWEGNPPMAPPNPSYSQNVQKLLLQILSFINSSKVSNSVTLSGFATRVEDLWNALLAENFVFSFRNTEEIVARQKLEEHLARWRWEMREKLDNVEKEIMNEIISNGSENAIEKKYIENNCSPTITDIMNKLNVFFSKNENEKMKKWEASTKTKIEFENEDNITRSWKKIQVFSEQKKACKSIDEEQKKYENVLLSHSKKVADQLRNQTSKDIDIEKEFKLMWNKWMTKIAPTAKAQITNVGNDTVSALETNFDEMNPTLRIRNKQFLQLKYGQDIKQYISIKKTFLVVGEKISVEKAIDETHKLTCRIEKKFDEDLAVTVSNKLGYSSTQIHKLISDLKKQVAEFQKNEKRFNLNNTYRCDLSIWLCLDAADKLQNMHDAFQKANDPRTYLERNRSQYLASFEGFCEGAISSQVLASLVGNNLKEAMQNFIFFKSCQKISNNIKNNFPAFNTNRSNLENHILKSLLEEMSFDKFREYLFKPKIHFEKYIAAAIQEFCWKDTASPLFKRTLFEYLEECKKMVVEAIQECTKSNNNVKAWLDGFCKELGSSIPLKRSNLSIVEHQNISDTNFLKDEMLKILPKICKELTQEIENETNNSTQPLQKQIQEKISENLCGCWNQCPFCKAICTNTSPDHDGCHSVDIHRPDGITGWHMKGTKNLNCSICTVNLLSDLSFYPNPDDSTVTCEFKEYRKAGAPFSEWNITPDSSVQPYWKWFVCTFQKELEAYHEKTFTGHGQIPSEWFRITTEDALASLKF